MGRIPDRWEDYQPMGTPVAGTRFISFKVPLNEGLSRCLASDQQFTPQMLISRLKSEGHPLGLVIDLTFTTRYYDGKEIESAGIDYVKIFTAGHDVPSAEVQKTFFDAVDHFLAENSNNDHLIGVHCTHGLNRTGYLVCRYMINRMNFEPQLAINAFNAARGYSIERKNYLADLLGITDAEVPSHSCFQSVANNFKPQTPEGRSTEKLATSGRPRCQMDSTETSMKCREMNSNWQEQDLSSLKRQPPRQSGADLRDRLNWRRRHDDRGYDDGRHDDDGDASWRWRHHDSSGESYARYGNHYGDRRRNDPGYDRHDYGHRQSSWRRHDDVHFYEDTEARHCVWPAQADRRRDYGGSGCYDDRQQRSSHSSSYTRQIPLDEY